MTKSANDIQDPSTCNFTGSETESGNENFWYIGWLENKIWKTISPSTTPTATIEHSGAHISSPQRMPVSMHATCHLLTCEGVLNTPPPGETDDGQTKSPSSRGRKRKTDGRRQTCLICKHGIGRDKIGLIDIH